MDSGKLRLYRVGMKEMDQPIDSYEVVLRHNVFGTEGQLCLYFVMIARLSRELVSVYEWKR